MITGAARFPLRAALCAVAFVAAFALVCEGIGSALRFPEVPLVRPKVEYLADHSSAYDTLFIGSSRLAYQIIPSLFDEAMAAGGAPVRSFNAAIAGMKPPEDGFMLDQILEHPPTHLRWVIIELSALRATVDRTRETVRAVYWHDWPRTWLILQRAYAKKIGEKRKRRSFKDKIGDALEPLGVVFEHLSLFFQRAANIGCGAELMDRFIFPNATSDTGRMALGEKLDGWTPASRPEVMTDAERADYERALAERRAVPVVTEFGDPVSQKALARLIGRVEQLGARVVLVVPPTTSKRRFYPQPALAEGRIILDFSDPEKYAELYQSEHRFDTEHVNTEGSRLFTLRFAQELLARLQPAR